MASSVIGALRVNLGADTAAFDKGLNDAKRSMSGFAKVVSGAVAGIAAAVSGSAFAGMVNRSMQALDAQAKLSRAIGGTVAGMQALERAASRSGVQQAEMEQGVARLNQRLGEAINRGKGAEGVFRILGITAEKLSQMDVDERLGAISTAMKAAGLNTQQMAGVLRDLGIRQASFITLMQSGTAELTGSRKALAEWGAILLKVDTDKIEVANDALADIGIVMQGMKNRIAVGLAEPLTRFALAITDSAKAGGILRGVLDGIVAASGLVAAAISAIASAIEMLNANQAVLINGLDTIAPLMFFAFGPTVYAAVVSLAGLIAGALTTAIAGVIALLLANPITAAFTLAVGAVYYFRDEIKKAIGVDVVQLIRDAANFIIQSFVAVFEEIKFVWQNLPAIIGSAAIGAFDVVASTISKMVSWAKTQVNELIGLVNMVPGVSIGKFGDSKSLEPLANSFADGLKDALAKHSATIEAITKKDYIGAIADSFRSSTSAVQEFDAVVAAVPANIENVGKASRNARTAMRGMRTMAQEVASTLKNSFAQAFNGLLEGSITAREAIEDILRSLQRLLVNKAFEALFAPTGAAGGLIGGLLGGARSNGGPVQSGRSYLVGERGPEIMMPSSNGRIIPNRELAGGSGGELVVTVAPSREFYTTVENTAQGVVTRSAPAIVGASVEATRRNLPGMIRSTQQRSL